MKTSLLVLLLTSIHYHLSDSADKSLHECSGKILDSLKGSGSYGDIPFVDHKAANIHIPKRFDSRGKWPNCDSIRRIYQQEKCGGCWAFATIGIMSDRMCIMSKAYFNDTLSIQDLMECCEDCGDCKEGYIARALKYWATKGIVSETCKYLETNTTTKGSFPKNCRRACYGEFVGPLYEYDLFYSTDIYQTRGIKNMQAEILLHGPVIAVMTTYTYVGTYKNKVLVYDKKLADKGGKRNHAVKLIGWDVIEKVPVWIIANSWGTDWGDDGFRYIRRGQNDFGIEEHAVATGAPAVVEEPNAKKGTPKSELIKTPIPVPKTSSHSRTIILSGCGMVQISKWLYVLNSQT